MSPFSFLLLCVGWLTVSTACAQETSLKTGAEQTEKYFPLLEGKRFALVVNQSSRIEDCSLVDSLCRSGLRPAFIFAPEHGFRGTADAGANINDDTDSITGLKIYSLYGKNKKPSAEQLSNIDLLVFDIQDVGCRFYTYLSTLHYLMEACAENQVELLILDRPNPNDHIDGPLLQENCRSFVGMHPIPILHGCTLGELAQMINGEHWLGDKQCTLRLVPVEGWKHGQPYSLPVKPSPNLPNDHAICLYPSLCLFEGTVISVGRGTNRPFERIGYPDRRFGDFCFTPTSLKGFDLHPMYENQCCYGIDLQEEVCPEGFNLSYLFNMFHLSQMGASFFKNPRFFDLLAGTEQLREQLLAGKDENCIRQSWQASLTQYKNIRKKYLLYP